MPWRDSLRPASFRGVLFKTEAGSKAGGRRGQTYEYPKRDDPSDEDLGRKARRFSVSGYVIGPDHNVQADRLQAVLEAEGPGQLVTQLMGSMRVRCETYTRTDRRQEGGVTSFDMVFVEAGTAASALVSESTQAQVSQAASAAQVAVVNGVGAMTSANVPLPAPADPATSVSV